jgi:hypothetical protein
MCDPTHTAVVAKFSYARFSREALDCVMATSALAYADDVAAEPQHLSRALRSSPSPEAWERFRAGRPGPDSMYSVFTPELMAVLERALELAEGPVETAHLAAALDS